MIRIYPEIQQPAHQHGWMLQKEVFKYAHPSFHQVLSLLKSLIEDIDHCLQCIVNTPFYKVGILVWIQQKLNLRH